MYSSENEFPQNFFGDRNSLGVKSPKIRGGGEIFEFPGAPEIDLSTEILAKIVNLGVKSPSLRGASWATFGASSPPFGAF